MIKGKKILIIDDDIILCRSISLLFSREGAQVFTAIDGREGLQTFFNERPDLVILDIMMPDIDGWQVCKQIRLMSETPIIMLTTLNQEETVITGLDAGADDFLSKPFSAGVLLARIRAVLRRSEIKTSVKTTKQYKDNYLQIDISERRVFVNGEPIKLSGREFDLLCYLLDNTGIVLSHSQILERVWGWEYRNNVDYVHVYISQLRKKLEKDPRKPRYIVTEHSIGYRFEEGWGY